MLFVSFAFLLCMLIKNRCKCKIVKHILHKPNNEAWHTHHEEQPKDASWSLAEKLWVLMGNAQRKAHGSRSVQMFVTTYNIIRWFDSSFTHHDLLA